MQNVAETEEERRLAQQFRDGDTHALDILFRRYHQRLCRDAQRFVSPEDAEEIVQDVFTALLIRQQTWTVETTVRQYLHTAVRNRARDRVARLRRDTTWQEQTAYDTEDTLTRIASPEDNLLLQELAHVIDTGLARCAPRTREVLQLAATLRRYADIGHALGIQSGTVHTLLARGRRRMRIYLRQQGWEDEVICAPSTSSRGTPSTHDITMTQTAPHTLQTASRFDGSRIRSKTVADGAFPYSRFPCWMPDTYIPLPILRCPPASNDVRPFLI